jgi:hypothetical protein
LTLPLERKRLILEQWRLTMKSGRFPMEWWMLTLVQMEMVNLELYVTVLKPWWLITEAWDPPLNIKEANSEAVWAKMRAMEAVLTFAVFRTISTCIKIRALNTIPRMKFV